MNANDIVYIIHLIRFLINNINLKNLHINFDRMITMTFEFLIDNINLKNLHINFNRMIGITFESLIAYIKIYFLLPGGEGIITKTFQ